MLMMHEPSDIKNVKLQFGASKFLTLYDAKQTLLLVISSAKDVYVFTTVFSVSTVRLLKHLWIFLCHSVCYTSL